MKRPKLIVIGIFLAILVLGNNLREFSYSTVPHPGESADEYSFGWLGISLIKDKMPTAWSGLPAYKNHDLQKINVDRLFDNDPNRPQFSIDKPWFDHPPLFGLIIGGFAYSKGIKNFESASVAILRRPMLKIGILTTILIFILGYKLYGAFVGLTASLIYSISPYMVISSRLALAENGYIPLFLSAIILAIYYFEKKNFWYWGAACMLAGIAVLIKLSAISIALSLLGLGLLNGGDKKKKLVIGGFAAITLGIAAFFMFGVYYGWETFVSVLFSNANRFYGAGAESFFQTVNQFRITTNKFLTDGWMVLGWISFFTLATIDPKKDNKRNFLIVPIVIYTFILLLFGSESYGWYHFPLLPFLAISTAVLLVKLFNSGNAVPFLFLLLLPFGTQAHKLIGVEGFQKFVPLFRFTLFFVFALFLLRLYKKDSLLMLSKLIMVSVLALTLLLSARVILFYNYDRWFFAT